MGMKISMNIDCTPQEARIFFGLPDLEPMNKAMMGEMEQRMKEHMHTLSDPEAFFKTWTNLSGQGLDQFQKFMSATMAGAKG